MAQVIVDEEEVLGLIEKSLRELSVEGRSLWTPHEIDPVVDNLLELWRIFNN